MKFLAFLIVVQILHPISSQHCRVVIFPGSPGKIPPQPRENVKINRFERDEPETLGVRPTIPYRLKFGPFSHDCPTDQSEGSILCMACALYTVPHHIII